MKKSIGCIEFRSICKGIEVSNEILKQNTIEVLYLKSICPGKFLIIFSGEAQEVKDAVYLGKILGTKYVVEDFVISNVHNEVINALKNSYNYKKEDIEKLCFGIVETTKVCSGIKALDYSLKSSNVNVYKTQLAFAIGGKFVFLITGSVSDVENAINNVKNLLDEKDIINTAIIPFISKEFIEKF